MSFSIRSQLAPSCHSVLTRTELDFKILATIHKLLSRDEMRNDPKAIEAIKEEGRGVRAKEVWLDSTAMENQNDLPSIHIAEVMPLASIKHWESPDRRRYKGRLVFHGDLVKDTWGAAARFGALCSAPTNTRLSI